MIETHCTPDKAWSDASQQITPKRLIQIMNVLRVRKTSFAEESFSYQLNTLRSHIDLIDDQLLALLKKRMLLSDEIGKLKKTHNVAILQSQRWYEILQKATSEGDRDGLSEEFVIQIFKAIHQESINRQEKIVKEK